MCLGLVVSLLPATSSGCASRYLFLQMIVTMTCFYQQFVVASGMVLCDKIHRHFLLWPHVSRRRGDSAEGTSVGRINLLIVDFVLGSFQLLIGFEEGFVCGYMTYDVRPLLLVVKRSMQQCLRDV